VENDRQYSDQKIISPRRWIFAFMAPVMNYFQNKEKLASSQVLASKD